MMVWRELLVLAICGVAFALPLPGEHGHHRGIKNVKGKRIIQTDSIKRLDSHVSLVHSGHS